MQSRKILGVPMLGVGNALTGTSRFKTTFAICSMYDQNFELNMTAYITPFITTINPISREAIHKWQHIKDLQLADPSHTNCQDIDLLIGSLTFSQILQEGLIKGEINEPIAQKTALGWITSGAGTYHENINTNMICDEQTCLITNDDLSNQLKIFWEVEEVTKTNDWSEEEKACYEYFTKTISRGEDGKFIMRIPFKLDPSTPNFLGDSFEGAKRRFLQLERRFARNPNLKIEYSKGIQEYLELGHAKKIPMDQVCHVIPHHAVVKETVYDASAKTTNGYSLNDRMYIGPTILEMLWAVLVRWRKGEIAITADIEKMYRQYWVHKDDTRYLQILWRNSTIDPLELLELQTVTFGTAAAPYMAIKGLHLIAETIAKKQPKLAKSIKKCFYVDDYVESFDTSDAAIQHKEQLSNVLSEYGLNLRKWQSNIDEIGENETIDIKSHSLTTCTTLGMQWNTKSDEISYKVDLNKIKPRITKRIILSDIASLFDPLGLLAPIIMQAKIFLQRLWLEKVNWDDDLPKEVEDEWKKIKNSLLRCSKIRIPRWTGYAENNQHISLHGFCDAHR